MPNMVTSRWGDKPLFVWKRERGVLPTTEKKEKKRKSEVGVKSLAAADVVSSFGALISTIWAAPSLKRRSGHKRFPSVWLQSDGVSPVSWDCTWPNTGPSSPSTVSILERKDGGRGQEEEAWHLPCALLFPVHEWRCPRCLPSQVKVTGCWDSEISIETLTEQLLSPPPSLWDMTGLRTKPGLVDASPWGNLERRLVEGGK